MYLAINIVQPEIFRARIDSVLGALATDAGARVAGEHFADRNAAKSAAHAEFMSAAGKNGRLQAQAAWKRALTLDNPSATELALLARSLYVCPTWLLTGKLAFINAELFAEHCLCWETPRSQHFVHYGATEPGGTLEYNPECLVHAGPGQTQTKQYRPSTSTDWSVPQLRSHPTLFLDETEQRQAAYRIHKDPLTKTLNFPVKIHLYAVPNESV